LRTGWDLVGYRCFQGIGASCIFANSGALLTDAFAPWKQVGLAMGVFQVFNKKTNNKKIINK
jgi:MFS family permease